MIAVIVFAWIFTAYICISYGEYIDPRYFSSKNYFNFKKNKKNDDN